MSNGPLPSELDAAIMHCIEHIVRGGKISFPGLPRSYPKEGANECEFVLKADFY